MLYKTSIFVPSQMGWLMYDDRAENRRKAVESIRDAAINLTKINPQDKEKIIRGVLTTQTIPMLHLVMPIILNLANEANLRLIAKAANDMIKKQT